MKENWHCVWSVLNPGHKPNILILDHKQSPLNICLWWQSIMLLQWCLSVLDWVSHFLILCGHQACRSKNITAKQMFNMSPPLAYWCGLYFYCFKHGCFPRKFAFIPKGEFMLAYFPQNTFCAMCYGCFASCKTIGNSKGETKSADQAWTHIRQKWSQRKKNCNSCLTTNTASM